MRSLGTCATTPQTSSIPAAANSSRIMSPAGAPNAASGSGSAVTSVTASSRPTAVPVGDGNNVAHSLMEAGVP